ncbi:homeotic protein ocelliless-like [Varroa destructor]|uniref:Homeobox domain-containing protein n=1 Tax=Varroa destructor TaxID=109461 RepID=A0A7M7JKW9_VARDE|nr:homeotic protein ocelliless-like [Varroa destructor]
MDKIKYTRSQLEVLELNFSNDAYLNVETANDLAAQLNVSVKQIRVWYQNRRAKLRRDGYRQDHFLSVNNTSTRSSWDCLTGGRLSSRSNSRSPTMHRARSAPSSPVRPYDRYHHQQHPPSPISREATSESASNSYANSTYDSSPQYSQQASAATYDTSNSWNTCDFSTTYSVTPHSPSNSSNNTASNLTPRPPASPYPDTAFCQQFNSVPAIVINDNQHDEDDLSVYLEENARDATDAYPYYGHRECTGRSKSAEPLGTANETQINLYYQPRDFSGLSTSHSYGSYWQNHDTYISDTCNAPARYSTMATSPTVPLNHAFHSLQMREAQESTASGQIQGQIQEPAAAHQTTLRDPSTCAQQYLAEESVSGEEAFIRSLNEFFNT